MLDATKKDTITEAKNLNRETETELQVSRCSTAAGWLSHHWQLFLKLHIAIVTV